MYIFYKQKWKINEMVNEKVLKRMKEELSEEEFEIESKKLQIMGLLREVSDPIFEKFFDVNSNELLDEKIEVLRALKDRKLVSDIPNYYKVLELYPNKDMLWD